MADCESDDHNADNLHVFDSSAQQVCAPQLHSVHAKTRRLRFQRDDFGLASRTCLCIRTPLLRSSFFSGKGWHTSTISPTSSPRLTPSPGSMLVGHHPNEFRGEAASNNSPVDGEYVTVPCALFQWPRSSRQETMSSWPAWSPVPDRR